MTNVPKPDLERGAYIVYTDEPGEILSPGSTGGGGAVYLEVEFSESTPPYIPKFTFNDVKNAIEAGNLVFTRSIYTFDGNKVMETYPVETANDNGSGEYTVRTLNLGFIATDPDVFMTAVDD